MSDEQCKSKERVKYPILVTEHFNVEISTNSGVGISRRTQEAFVTDEGRAQHVPFAHVVGPYIFPPLYQSSIQDRTTLSDKRERRATTMNA